MWIQFFCPNGTNALLPRIEQRHTRSLKIAPIPRDNGEAVHQRGGGDESFTVGHRIRHMQARATQRDRRIDRQDAASEGWQHMAINPATQDLALLRIAALDSQHTNFQFQQTDHGQIQAGYRYAPSPAFFT
jgi:hypothetical protein